LPPSCFAEENDQPLMSSYATCSSALPQRGRSSLTDHRTRGPSSATAIHLRRRARRGFERRERAQRVAHQRDARGARQHATKATSQSASASTEACAGPAERPWPGQVDGQRVVAVVREIARLQRPHAWSFAAPWTKPRSAACATKSASRCTRRRATVDLTMHVLAFRVRVQRAAQVFDQSSGILEPIDRTYRALGDSALRRSSAAHPEVCRRRRMDHERFRVADVGEMREELHVSIACVPAHAFR
jgi:hypothetical protein